MKKYIIALVIALSIPLQGLCFIGHATYLDVPINGTITKFEKALINKHGYKLTDDKENKQNTGTKYYIGKYGAMTIPVFVYYNPTDKLVYRVRMRIPVKDEESAYKILNFMSETVTDDWQVGLNRSTHGNYPSYEGYIMETDHQFKDRVSLFDTDYTVGWMELFIGTVGDKYSVLIDIYDLDNSIKYGKLPQNAY